MNTKRGGKLIPTLFSACVMHAADMSAMEPKGGAGEGAPHIYLLMGQSNMAGRDRRRLEEQREDPRIFAWTPEEGEWRMARDPIHEKIGRPEPGQGPGISFARELRREDRDQVVGLVPLAVGGSPLSRWVKGGDLYERALSRAREAAATGGELKGVIWHQGETDASRTGDAERYEERLAGMIRDLRADLEEPDLPVVLGTLGGFLRPRRQPHAGTVNDAIRSVAASMEGVGVVEGVDLGHQGDDLHFSASASMELGRRYGVEMRRLHAEGRARPLRLFRDLEAGRRKTVVVYGTSLTKEGEWADALERYLEEAYPGQVRFLNRAQSGQHSRWGVEQLEGRVLDENPDLVFIEFAINDAAHRHGISPENTMGNLNQMVASLRAQNPRVEIVLQTMNPAWDAPEESNGKTYGADRPHLGEYYEALRSYARRMRLPLLDHAAVWNSLRGEAPERFKAWVPDGIHPNAEGSLAVTWKGVKDFLEQARGESAGKAPLPTLEDVAYGSHPRQTLSLWRATSDAPTPVVFHLHGGAWVVGDNENPPDVQRYLDAGVSVVAIRYRYTTDAKAQGVEPPVSGPMRDAARALQMVRHRAEDWSLDSDRIVATGNSAGGCTALWLAFHEDLSEPDSADPVARQSTRLLAVAVDSAQTTLDPHEMREWTPNSMYGGHAFGFPYAPDRPERAVLFEKFHARRDEVLPWIRAYSPVEHVRSDAPPVYMSYPRPPAPGREEPDPTHSANFGVLLAERLREHGIPFELVTPDAPEVKHPTRAEYVIRVLDPSPR